MPFPKVPCHFTHEQVLSRLQYAFDGAVPLDLCLAADCFDPVVAQSGKEEPGLRLVVSRRVLVLLIVFLINGEEVVASFFYNEADIVEAVPVSVYLDKTVPIRHVHLANVKGSVIPFEIRETHIKRPVVLVFFVVQPVAILLLPLWTLETPVTPPRSFPPRISELD